MGRPVGGPSGLGSPEALSVGRQMRGGGASASWGAAGFVVLRVSAYLGEGHCVLMQKGGQRGAGFGLMEGCRILHRRC